MPIILKIKIHPHSCVVLQCLVLCRQVLWNRRIGLELCNRQVNASIWVELSLDGEWGGGEGGGLCRLDQLVLIWSVGSVGSLRWPFPDLMRLQERELSFLVKGEWGWILGGVLGKILGRRVGGGMARVVGVRWRGVMGWQGVLAEWGI